MMIKMNELEEFVDFLRKSCGVQQLTSFHPAPNEAGEFFRALAENHLIIAHLKGDDDLCIFSDDQYRLVLGDRWSKRPKNKELVSTSVAASATARLKALLLGNRLPTNPAVDSAITPANKGRDFSKVPAGSIHETIDLSS